MPSASKSRRAPNRARVDRTSRVEGFAHAESRREVEFAEIDAVSGGVGCGLEFDFFERADGGESAFVAFELVERNGELPPLRSDLKTRGLLNR